jgi:hypothetical protein
MSSQNEIKEVAGEIVGWDARIMQTIKGLTLQPGVLIRDFCSGNAPRYVSPIAYYFTGVSIMYYLFEITGFSDFLLAISQEDLANNLKDLGGIIDVQKAQSLRNSFIGFLSSETASKLISLVLALLLRWLIFRKQEKSFKLNAWFSMFTMGHESVLVGIPALMGWMIVPDRWVALGVIMVLGFIYDTWASKQFYAIGWGRSVWLNLILTVLTNLLVSFFIFVGILVSLFMSAK